jgi:hypothetical protein
VMSLLVIHKVIAVRPPLNRTAWPPMIMYGTFAVLRALAIFAEEALKHSVPSRVVYPFQAPQGDP